IPALVHNVFEDRSIRDHSIIWARIARRISNNYNFIVIQNQCRNKWRALKRGFENLTRINNGIGNDADVVLEAVAAAATAAAAIGGGEEEMEEEEIEEEEIGIKVNTN
ncbi:unnamed protein product, partial [Rhizophagus irregularis]